MQKKTKRMNLILTEKTDAQIAELQRILSAKIGAPISKTAAIEIAIDKLLQGYAANPEQMRLI